MRQIHALTPGDHFSPRTGSAVATVVHGIAAHTDPRPAVLVARGTYPERYGTAEIIEYEMKVAPHGASQRLRAVDAAIGWVGAPRPWGRAVHRQVLEDQDRWEPGFVLAHNSPQMIPLVSHRHAPVLYAHNDLLAWYSARESRRVLASAHRVVAVSEFLAERLAPSVPSCQSRLVVVPNGVDVEAFAVPRASRPGSLRVGFVGRVIDSKGVHVLLEAVRRLGRPDIGLTVVGSGGFDPGAPLTPYEKDLRLAAKRLASPVRFLPFQPRAALPSILAEMDVLVVPSIFQEPFGLTVLEGMAAGAAVIATRAGGIPEAAGHAALLVGPNDSEELAGALEHLVDSDSEVARLARLGRARAAECSWSRSARVLKEALAGA